MGATHVALTATLRVDPMRPGRLRRFCILEGTKAGDDLGTGRLSAWSCRLATRGRLDVEWLPTLRFKSPAPSALPFACNGGCHSGWYISSRTNHGGRRSNDARR
jgi:hypothetical protein